MLKKQLDLIPLVCIPVQLVGLGAVIEQSYLFKCLLFEAVN